MPILATLPEHLRDEFGIRCRRFFPHPALPTPFGASFCVVEPGGSTLPHAHFEGETFYLAEGEGLMAIEGEPEATVRAGDVVFIAPERRHTLRNLSATQPLRFYSVWWEPAHAQPALPARSLVVTAPPTPNGPLHLGHLSGPYLAADAYARYMRQRGVEAHYLTGTDDHQSYTAVKAEALGEDAAAVAARFGDGIERTLEACGVQVGHCLRPAATPAYTRFVQAFFERLRERGQLVVREAPTLHCPDCALDLHEARVTGGCPHCGEATMGNGCEGCYRPNDCTDLRSPRCVRCGAAPETRLVRRFYFPMEPHRERLEAHYRLSPLAPQLRALAETLLADELPEVAISHPAAWGIPVPDAAFDGQILYEWFEMAAGFLWSAAQLAPDGRWERWWKDAEAEVVQFFGLDNAFFFVAFLPAVLLAYDPEIRLPRALVTNEFYRLDGRKFSTSRRHAIWADEALAHVPADAWRLYLALDRPEHAQTSFTLAAMRAEIAGISARWTSWLTALAERREAAFSPGAALPALAPEALDAEQRRFQARLQDLMREGAARYDAGQFSLRHVARSLSALAEEAACFGEAQAALRAVPSAQGAWRAAVALELAALRAFAQLAAPLMPGFAAELAAPFGLAALGWDEALDGSWAGELGPLAVPGTLEAALAGLEALEASREGAPA